MIDCLRGTPDAIDGDLSDWNLEAMTPAVLDVVEQLNFGQENWTGPEDCSGEFYLLWDDVNIYMAVVVKDEKLSMNKTDGDIWNADAVEIFFATTDAEAEHSWTNPTIHYQYGFNANNQKWNWCNMHGPGQSEPDYLQIASSVTADGYICEASIEYGQMLSLDFSAGNTLGFHAVLDDTDNGDAELQMTWTGLGAHDQSMGYGHMLLSELTAIRKPAMGPIRADVGNSHNAEELEEGFTSFTLDDSGSQVNGITIEFAGINAGDSRRRDVPSGVPFENIYRDFIFSRQSEAGVGYVSVTLSGLQADVAYDITLYSWDTYSTGIRIADWTANGELLFTTVHDGNVDPPAAEDDYAYTGTATADANGVILMEAVPGEGTFTDQPFAFINALVVSLAPPTIPFSLGAVGDIELGNDEQVGPDSNSNGSGLGARDIGARRRVALISYDISELKGKGPVSNVSFNNFSHDQHDEVSVYGIIEDLDLLDVESLTWNTAPGVQNDPIPDLGAPVALDPNDLTDVLLKFAGPGDTGVRFSTDTSQALADFINSDTDGIVTFLLAASAEDYQLIIRSREHSAGGALLEGVQPAPVDPGSDGLVAYYALENDVLDASGNGNDGTIVGNPTVVEGPAGYGMAMEFHGLGAPGGGGDYIDCGNDASLDIPGPLSIALWIKPGADDPEGQGTETAPMAKAMSGVGWSWQVRYGWGSDQPYMAFTFNTSPRAWAYVGRNLERDEWCHIACSHDGTTLKCYLNGEQTDSTPMGQITSSEAPVLIGSDGWGCDWIGAIDEVAIYNRALSDSEIMYLAGK